MESTDAKEKDLISALVEHLCEKVVQHSYTLPKKPPARKTFQEAFQEFLLPSTDGDCDTPVLASPHSYPTQNSESSTDNSTIKEFVEVLCKPHHDTTTREEESMSTNAVPSEDSNILSSESESAIKSSMDMKDMYCASANNPISPEKLNLNYACPTDQSSYVKSCHVATLDASGNEDGSTATSSSGSQLCMAQNKENNIVSHDIEMKNIDDSTDMQSECDLAKSHFSEEKNVDCHSTNVTSPVFPDVKTMTQRLVGESADFGHGNFLKGCKWAPDGLCFMLNTNCKQVHIINAPYQSLNDRVHSLEAPVRLETCLKIQEPGTIYDYSWWPLMNSQEPVTCCFATTASAQPVHLWDAFNGQLRASYIALNSVDEISAAYSLCFSNDGRQLLCGFQKDVCLFYTDRPGAHYERWSTAKKKQRRSQNNIISCTAFSHDDALFACGAYDGTVGLYSPVNGHLLDFTAGHQSGVTCLRFSRDGYRLYTGERMGRAIHCWDIRNLKRAVCTMHRRVATNQRVYFDLVSDSAKRGDRYVVSGSTDGHVRFYETADVLREIDGGDAYNWETSELEPTYTFEAHSDCVNGCDLHPFVPLLLTASGQRTLPELCDSDDDDSDVLRWKSKPGENRVKIWHLGNKLVN